MLYGGTSVGSKFDGCYHGHAAAMLVSAGSGVATMGLTNSPGVTTGAVADMVSLPFNNLVAVEAFFMQKGYEIAAVIVEPIAGNMGLVLPRKEFLPGLRELTLRSGALLIFDEVMSGARVAAGGAQVLFGIEPDLTTLGKVIGGGLPAAAYGGRADVMRLVSPAGPVYQAGTLSGNPLVMASGIATMRELERPNSYELLGKASRALADGVAAAAAKCGIAVQSAAVGGMWGFSFRSRCRLFDSKTRKFVTFCTVLSRLPCSWRFLPPSQFEACFV